MWPALVLKPPFPLITVYEKSRRVRYLIKASCGLVVSVVGRACLHSERESTPHGSGPGHTDLVSFCESRGRHSESAGSWTSSLLEGLHFLLVQGGGRGWGVGVDR